MPTYLFTIQDLLDLINESSAARSLDPDQLLNILKLAHQPKSEPAQNLYETLIEERNQYLKIDKNTIAETNHIYTDFELKVEGLKHKNIRQKMEQAEQEYEKTEKEAAQKLLKSLKNK